MKTAYGKLIRSAVVLLMIALLFLPMRAGEEDKMLLTPGKLKMSVGDSYEIACALSTDDYSQRVHFYSSNEKIAAINSSGLVHALASGEATIYAKATGGARAEMQVEVVGVPMTVLELNTDELHIEKGQFSGLRASYNNDASDTRLQWLSADESIARVDISGRIEGVGGGQTYVSVIAPNGLSASAKVYVDVAGVAAHISPNDLTVGVGARVPLKVMFLPLDCTDTVRRWISSDEKVAVIDENGVLRALSQGTVYISMQTYGGLTRGMEVVVEAGAKDMQLNPSRATLERGEEMDLQVLYLDANDCFTENTSHLVVWESDDPSVASVDENGHVRALRSGVARISATSDGFTAVCHVQVETNIQEITLDRSETTLLRAQTEDPIALGWTISPADPDDPTVHFTSNNEQVALVSPAGVVTLTGGYGTAVITAQADSGASAQFTVHVVVEEAQAAPAAAVQTPEQTQAPTPAPTPDPTPEPEPTIPASVG